MAESNQIPRIAIRSVSGGLVLMAFFTMMWTGIGQAGFKGSDYRIHLIINSIISFIFLYKAVSFFRASRNFPIYTSDEDTAAGKKMGKAFAIIFGLEGTLIPIVCGILAAMGYELFILPAIAMIVGLHFYPMAKIFNRTIDYFLATWTCLISATSIYLIPSNEALALIILGTCVSLTTISYGFYMIRSGNLMLREKRYK